MTEINANSPLHNINPPITGINPPLENGNPVNPVNNGVSAPEQNVVQKGTEAKSLSLKLDSMMIRAAQLATRSVDVNALAETVKDVPLDETMRTALDDAAERAKSALSELSRLSGREIAEALEDKDGKLNFKADNEAADAIREAIDAQAKLSEMLHKLVNSPHTDAAVADQLLEMALQCDRRQSEIMTLTMELTDAVHATGDNTVPRKTKATTGMFSSPTLNPSIMTQARFPMASSTSSGHDVYHLMAKQLQNFGVARPSRPWQDKNFGVARPSRPWQEPPVFI